MEGVVSWTGRMEGVGPGTNEGKTGQKSEFSQAGQGLIYEKAPDQGLEQIQPSSLSTHRKKRIFPP